MTVADWIIRFLQEHGVPHIAALCGHGLDPLFEAASKAGMRLIDTRNEQTAGYIAECYGRLTRTPGVCATSSGVAAANAMTGVMNAWFDGAPMLYLSGSANSSVLGMGCFQDIDQAELLRPITRYSRILDTPAKAGRLLQEAWQEANTPGPAHLQIPMDVQRAEVGEMFAAPAARTTASSNREQVTAMLRTARRPLIVATSDAYYSGEGDALLAFAEKHSIPVQTPIWDRGICDRSSPVFVGVLGALSRDPGLLALADAVVVTGPINDYRVAYWKTSAPIVRVDGGWADIDAPKFDAWLAEARALRTEFSADTRAIAAGQRISGRIHAVDIVDAIDAALPEDGTLVIDGGSIGQWAHHLLAERRYPGNWLSCGVSGVVGYGIGGAMAARLARPDKPVLLLSGDGAFTFTVAELECAVRQNLPFVALVADDQCWGITHSGHLRQFGQGIATQLGAIDFAALAESLGARGIRIDSAAALAPAIREALALPRVTVLHVPISGGNPG
ncbi:MAG: thiamine pyrophosphate-binding protein [Candidatus Solibacter usitatus]|nr:thiamine pyrophosphate-binding protein [Candidatus Solibacter usitatus]